MSQISHKPAITLEHSDSRGEIFSISLPDNRELMLLHSKPGSLRGGHAHDVSEVIVLLTGRMTYTKTMNDGQDTIRELRGGDCSFNEAMEYHLASFPEDSWLLEFKINTDKKGWKNIDLERYRALVRANAAS